ncbi:hypothetical protein B566_EDAN011356 [Ephemera danica]|nr:hypothetical protein B566_EDAN011356 [Ephemera danica]
MITYFNISCLSALAVKYKSSCTAHHWLYCKEHSVREKHVGKPAGRTLFIINVPPYYTEKCMNKLFNQYGTVTAVYFHKNPTSSLPPEETSKIFHVHQTIKGFKVAYVVFDSPSCVSAIQKLNWSEPAVVWDAADKDAPIAIDRWKAEYDARIPDVEELQAEIDSFMEKHDKQVSEEERKLKETEGQPDDEGWITVTRRGNKPGFARKESVEQRVLAKESKKKANKELKNFYQFQIRESKMNNLAELRHKFEEDKKKIAQLRQARKFRPY